MAIAVTAAGGATSGHSVLSPAERQAAQHALARLGTSNTNSSFASSAPSATLSGGVSLKASPGTATSKLISGPGSDTFAVGATQKPGVANDVAVSGSFAAPQAGHGGVLSPDTINVAGHTASAVKAEEATSKSATSTITLSDKTTVTLTGIPTHNIVKPH